MPGIFGAVRCPPELFTSLERLFSAPWGEVASLRMVNGILGGHAFSSRTVLNTRLPTLAFVVDGEASIYARAESASSGQSDLFHVSSNLLTLNDTCKGNVAAVDLDTNVWHLAAEWTGVFPLYYTRRAGGFLFCSRLRPLAQIIKAEPDFIAITEFLNRGYILTERSFFRGIRRLLPGQSIAYSADRDHLKLFETSTAWVSQACDHLPGHAPYPEMAWRALSEAVKSCIDRDRSHALMMSAGWDSRTLLAALSDHVGRNNLLGYSHGDTNSRELRVTRSILQSVGIRSRQEPIDDTVFDLDLLSRGFERVENVTWPNWHRDGKLLGDLGRSCVSAGVYGEVLGGHYGPAILLQGTRKATSVAMDLVARSTNTRFRGPDEALDFLRFRHTHSWKPRVLTDEVWDALDEPLEAIDSDLEASIKRLEKRGVLEGDRLIEAFIAEHRGSQYICSQLLSCRAHLDITLPFADRNFLNLVSRIPQHFKVHNQLNREMLRRYAPHLLRFPTGAVPLQAGAPILLQESSRFCRYMLDRCKLNLNSFLKLNLSSSSYLNPLTETWLRSLAASLCSDVWDRKVIFRDVQRLAGLRRLPSYLLRVSTVDRLISNI